MQLLKGKQIYIIELVKYQDNVKWKVQSVCYVYIYVINTDTKSHLCVHVC